MSFKHYPGCDGNCELRSPAEWRCVGYNDGVLEGERRATARIVADLRDDSDLTMTHSDIQHALADRYESGAHVGDAKADEKEGGK